MSAQEYFSAGGGYEQNPQHDRPSNSMQSPWSPPPTAHTPSSSTYEGSYPPSDYSYNPSNQHQPPHNAPLSEPQPGWGPTNLQRPYEGQSYPEYRPTSQSPYPLYQEQYSNAQSNAYGSPGPHSPYYRPQEGYAQQQYQPQRYDQQNQHQQPPPYEAPSSESNPAPAGSEEKGFLGALAGGATGAYAGHQVHHGFLGAIGGAMVGSVAQDAIKNHKKKKEKKKWGIGRRDSSSSSSSSSSDNEHHHHHHHHHQESPQPGRHANQNFLGNFSASSNEIRLEGGYELVAHCLNAAGHSHRSSIPLNNVLTNTFGKFNWARGGNFGASARHVRLIEGGRVLEAELANGHGGWDKAWIQLDERISNQDGNLVFLD